MWLEPLAKHVHCPLQQVLSFEGVGGLRSIRARLRRECQTVEWRVTREPICTSFFCPGKSSSISERSGRSLMISFEVCSDTLKTRVSRDVRQRDSRLKTLLRIISTEVVDMRKDWETAVKTTQARERLQVEFWSAFTWAHYQLHAEFGKQTSQTS